eukprot:12478249-Heterocapsa_arctica.AAC.1
MKYYGEILQLACVKGFEEEVGRLPMPRSWGTHNRTCGKKNGVKRCLSTEMKSSVSIGMVT